MTTWYNYIHSYFYEDEKLKIQRDKLEHQKHLLNKQIINSNIKLKPIKPIQPQIQPENKKKKSKPNPNYYKKSKPIPIPKLKPTLSKLIEDEFD